MHRREQKDFWTEYKNDFKQAFWPDKKCIHKVLKEEAQSNFSNSKIKLDDFNISKLKIMKEEEKGEHLCIKDLIDVRIKKPGSERP